MASASYKIGTVPWEARIQGGRLQRNIKWEPLLWCCRKCHLGFETLTLFEMGVWNRGLNKKTLRVMIQPCGHQCICSVCAHSLERCPWCDVPIENLGPSKRPS
jgi:hypothetical protein